MKNLLFLRWQTVAVLVVTTLVACSPANNNDITRAQFFAMGTLVDISLHGVETARADTATRAVEDIFHKWQTLAHPWQPGPLVTLNAQLARGETATVDPHLVELAGAAKVLAHQSHELFNPGIGRIVALWGFYSDEPALDALPKTPEIQRLTRPPITLEDLKITDNTLHSTDPRLQLDFGAFAKGYAVDRAIDVLRELGINDAIVNAGGDLRAIGNAGDRPWRIGIRDPRGNGILAAVEISGDTSVFTSGDYERFVEIDGHRYHHILDPRSGYPATGLTSVTVISNSGARADAAATALLVAGPEHWSALAKTMNLNRVMVVKPNGDISMTAAISGQVKLRDSQRPVTVLGATTP